MSDAGAKNSAALRVAARDGHADVVKLLIPISDPKALDSQALTLSAQKGYAECVRVLIPVSDPKANDSLALQSAVMNGHDDIVDLLWEVSDPQAALQILKRNHPHNQEVWTPLQRRIAEKQHAQIQHAVQGTKSVHQQPVKHRNKI